MTSRRLTSLLANLLANTGIGEYTHTQRDKDGHSSPLTLTLATMHQHSLPTYLDSYQQLVLQVRYQLRYRFSIISSESLCDQILALHHN